MRQNLLLHQGIYPDPQQVDLIYLWVFCSFELWYNIGSSSTSYSHLWGRRGERVLARGVLSRKVSCAHWWCQPCRLPRFRLRKLWVNVAHNFLTRPRIHNRHCKSPTRGGSQRRRVGRRPILIQDSQVNTKQDWWPKNWGGDWRFLSKHPRRSLLKGWVGNRANQRLRISKVSLPQADAANFHEPSESLSQSNLEGSAIRCRRRRSA